ncbi:MAG: competence/damage-inducible protein A [Alphaproteobacteria bacterium]|nr:competence/damage-inducible protein A [Alphaproteobacteria bacterium]
MSDNPTAAVLVIGDEILSGRTQDTNTNYIAKLLGTLGIDLREARVVGDVEDEIVAALDALRRRYTYVFTTGGIGPTHDDITVDAVAKAFGVGVEYHPEALAMLTARYRPGEFNDTRKRMARVPRGAELVRNEASVAPGIRIGNVFVMAGVPTIMRAMMEDVAPKLARGAVVHSATVGARVGEGRIAEGLARIARAFPELSIGSYPFYRDDGYGTQLVARGRDAARVEEAAREIESLVRAEGAAPERI